MDYSILIGVIPAIITCFWGYKLHRLLIVLTWFLVGALLGYSILTIWFNPMISFLLSLVIGFISGFLGIKLYKVGIFLMCFLLAFGIIYTLIPQEIVRWILSIGCGILVGLLGVKFSKIMIMATTSISGGFAIGTIVLPFLNLATGIVPFLISVIISICGYFVQSSFEKN